MLKNATVHQVRIDSIKPYQNNAKIHGPEQVRKIADSIKEFGFLNPILLDSENMILCGHGRLEAARLLGMEEVPCLYADGLTEAQKRAYILADNKLGELADWDTGLISEELKALQMEGFDINLTGFDVDDIIFDESMEPDVEPAPAQEKLPPITKPGEVWKLGDHRLMIGDSADPDQVRKLTEGEPMDLLETDPPYNVDIGITDIEEAKRRRRRTDGKVIAHDAMTDEDFRDFLRKTIGNGLDALRPGGCITAGMQIPKGSHSGAYSRSSERRSGRLSSGSRARSLSGGRTTSGNTSPVSMDGSREPVIISSTCGRSRRSPMRISKQ